MELLTEPHVGNQTGEWLIVDIYRVIGGIFQTEVGRRASLCRKLSTKVPESEKSMRSEVCIRAHLCITSAPSIGDRGGQVYKIDK
jgi:hypothetical protein